MGTIAKIARRTFLVGSVAVAGGIAFGIYQVKKPMQNPLHPIDADDVVLNPYIIINADGVTIITPRAEMGQGVQSTLAALVAEELDVAWDQIKIMHGPAAQVYYNQALFGAAIPVADYSAGDVARALGRAMGGLAKVLALQVTGGSTSMKDGYEKMRHAGATARETLKEAAARRLNVAARQLRTENGTVIGPDGTILTYAELAADAALIDPPDVTLRPSSDWKYLGTDMPRLDIPAKVTGNAEFGIDVRLNGMKYAALRANPHLGGGIKSLDDAPALALAGVEKVINLGNAYAVIANNTWIAFQGLDAVTVEWEASPNPSTTPEMFSLIRAALDGDANSDLRTDGDADTVPQGATEISAEYVVPYLAHATMEPMNATVHLTDDHLSMWIGTQAPPLFQSKAAEILGLKPEQVDIYTTLMGGGFGRRGEFDVAVYAAKIAAQMKGTPVKITWSRDEDMTHDFYRPGAVAQMRGAVKDGTAVLFDAKIAAQSTAQQAGSRMTGFPMGGPDSSHMEGMFDQPYSISNYRTRGYLAQMDVPVGFWRSVAASFNGFFHDTFMDELAHAAGADPLEFRLQHMRDEHPASARVLETVRDMCGWTGQKMPGIGRGVAFSYSFGTPCAQVVEVAQTQNGIRLNRAWIACDVGVALDPQNIRAQMFGGMAYGLSAAMFGEITFTEGAVEQQNFPDYDAIRMHTMPRVQIEILTNGEHISGVGEPGTPPAAPALGNALFDLTGTRARELPLIKTFDLMT